MEEAKSETTTPYKANYGSYLLGFGLSLALTLIAYGLVLRHVNSHHLTYSHTFMKTSLISLALIQLLVQLVLFLHLGRESKPRWNLLVFLFALMVVLILVLGSLWIMFSLNYHHSSGMTPAQTDESIIRDEGVQKP